MKEIKRNLARKILERDEDGLFRIPLLSGIKEKEFLTFTNRKKVMKFFGPYVLRTAAGKVVYEYDRERDERLRLRDAKARRQKLLKQAPSDPFDSE